MADVLFDQVVMEMGQFLRLTGLEQYQQILSLTGVVSLENLTSLTHEELEQLAVEINMSGEDLQQLKIQSYIFHHGPRRYACGPIHTNSNYNARTRNYRWAQYK